MRPASPLKARFASLLVRSQEPVLPRIPTGILEVDQLTGGIPRAAFTEIAGGASSGRTALLVSVLRQAMSQGEYCSLVDAQDSFDPESATAVGLQAAQLFWVRCAGNVEHALKAADLLIHSGGFGAIALDLGDVPDRLTCRIPLALWHRLRRGAEHSGTALVVAAEQIHARSCSRLQLELRKRKDLWTDKLLQGIVSQAEMRKRNQSLATSFHALR